MRLPVTASGSEKKSTHLLISTALHTGIPNASSRLQKQQSVCPSFEVVGRKALPRGLLILIFRCWLSGSVSAWRTSGFPLKHSLGIEQETEFFSCWCSDRNLVKRDRGWVSRED